jgi:hypothetical protein
MIIDCDTHLMPREAFDGIDGEFGPRKPTLKLTDGLYVDVEFPGYPPEVPGTSPLLAPGSGAMFKSLWDVVTHGRPKAGIGSMLSYRQFRLVSYLTRLNCRRMARTTSCSAS